LTERDEQLALPHETLTLLGGHVLDVDRSNDKNVLRIVRPDGAVSISITITPQGVTMSLAGADLLLETTGALAVRADTLSLHGERGVSVTTGGDLTTRAEGNVTTEGFSQRIQARRGDIDIKANDDVFLDGERVRLNSPRTPLEEKTQKMLNGFARKIGPRADAAAEKDDSSSESG
jgi:hypothetical protein